MAIKLSGLVSGMDTDSMVKELVSAHQTKIDNVEKKKTKLEWKKEQWASLNTKIYALYTGELTDLKTRGTYNSKKVTSTDSSKATITAGNGVSNGVHTLEVKSIASSAYLTGNKMTDPDGNTRKGTTTLESLGIAAGSEFKLTVGTGSSAKDYTIAVDSGTTLSDFASKLSEQGINASYDSTQGRFFLSSKATGAENEINLTCQSSAGELSTEDSLSALGLNINTGASKVDASDATIIYNSATFTQSSNTFNVNGLSIVAQDVTDTYNDDGTIAKSTPIKVTVATDTDAIYNKVKNFVTAYNSLISEMNDKYNADLAKDYEPLTDDEKDAMTDDQIEKWETKIKDSLLRRDSTLGTLLSTMRSTLNGSVPVTSADGTTTNYSLSSFGIVTGLYSENGKLHIYGDATDSEYADNEDKLRAAIEANPDAVMETLTKIGSNLYSTLSDKMKSTTLSSALTFYNDKYIQGQIDDYEDSIDDLEDKLSDLEERYYKQFTSMETAMSNLNSQTASLTSLFGTSS